MSVERMNFNDLMTLAAESIDGLDYDQIVKVLAIVQPGIEIAIVNIPEGQDGYMDTYLVTFPERT